MFKDEYQKYNHIFEIKGVHGKMGVIGLRGQPGTYVSKSV